MEQSSRACHSGNFLIHPQRRALFYNNNPTFVRRSSGKYFTFTNVLPVDIYPYTGYVILENLMS